VTASDEDRDRDGERVLAWIGVKAVPGATGLVVASVAPGSRAEAAGLAAGDVVASFDGVRVASAGDVLPAPGEREAAVGVRHGSAPTETMRTVSVDGFRHAPPVELLAAALVLLAALAIVMLFGAPARPAVAAALQRVVSRMRARVGAVRAVRVTAWGKLGRAMVAVARDALPPAGAPALVDVLACALLAAMPFGQYLVASQLDVGLLFVAAATALAAAALVASRSPWRGLRAAAHVAWQHAPAAAAVAGVVVTTGSLRVQEIEHAQGGWPWDWLAFRSPAALVALVLLLACARIEPDGSDAVGVGALVDDAAASGRGLPRGPWLEAACRAHRIAIAGLASALFLGGWLLPGLSASEQDARPALEVAGAAWLLLKTWGVVLVLAWARWALPRRRMAERTRVTALWLAPLSAAALVATAAWTWWSPTRAAQLLVSGSLVAAVGLAGLALAQRVRHGLLSPGGDGHLSPFL
jgi:NADH-quinone oxidoreductase subunit H